MWVQRHCQRLVANNWVCHWHCQPTANGSGDQNHAELCWGRELRASTPRLAATAGRHATSRTHSNSLIVTHRQIETQSRGQLDIVHALVVFIQPWMSSERQKTCGAHQRGATMHGHLHCSQRIDKGAQTAPRDSACPAAGRANGCRQAQLGRNLPRHGALGRMHLSAISAATRQARQPGSNLPCDGTQGQTHLSSPNAATKARFPGSCV